MESEHTRRFKGPGGTSGGLGTFLFGLVMVVAGGYLIMNQVRVTSGYWGWWGANTFGLTTVPLIFGVGLLFFNGKSVAGWMLTIAGVVIILAGIISSLHIYWQQSSLFDFLLMIVLFVGGLGLVARSFR